MRPRLPEQAPKWEFPLEETHAGAGGGNAPPSPEGHLYLGALPARPPANCAAILAYRPAVLPPGMSGILGTGDPSCPPPLPCLRHFCFNAQDVCMRCLPSKKVHFTQCGEGAAQQRHLDRPQPADSLLETLIYKP